MLRKLIRWIHEKMKIWVFPIFRKLEWVVEEVVEYIGSRVHIPIWNLLVKIWNWLFPKCKHFVQVVVPELVTKINGWFNDKYTKITNTRTFRFFHKHWSWFASTRIGSFIIKVLSWPFKKIYQYIVQPIIKSIVKKYKNFVKYWTDVYEDMVWPEFMIWGMLIYIWFAMALWCHFIEHDRCIEMYLRSWGMVYKHCVPHDFFVIKPQIPVEYSHITNLGEIVNDPSFALRAKMEANNVENSRSFVDTTKTVLRRLFSEENLRRGRPIDNTMFYNPNRYSNID